MVKNFCNSCPICKGDVELLVGSLSDDRYGYSGLFNIFRCGYCGFSETLPRINKKDNQSLYTRYYPRRNFDVELVKRKTRSFNWNLLKKLSVWWKGEENVCHYLAKKGDVVLDVGCGDCTSLVEMRKMGAVAFGTEQDENVKIIGKELGLNIFIGSLENYPKNKKFDVISASQVVEHQEDPNKMIGEMKGLLNEKGIIVISFPNIDSIYRKVFGRFWINWHVPFHQSFLTYNSLKIIADNNELEIYNWRTVTPTLWTIYQLINLLPIRKNKKVEEVVWGKGFAKNRNIIQEFARNIYKIIEGILSVVISPVNRMIDYSNIGDSCVVVLRYKNQ